MEKCIQMEVLDNLLEVSGKEPSLQKLFYGLCSKEIKCNYPCDSCYGCRNKVEAVKKWLQRNHDLIESNTPCTSRDEQKDCDNMILISALIKNADET